jgi:hypothetical protein
MKYKEGQTLYSVCIEDDGKCSMDIYKVRTIRGGIVHAILFDTFTWGKKSKKHGDFGWLDPIPNWCRERCKEGEKFRHLYTTKLSAWKDAEKIVKKIFDEDEEESIKATKTIKSQIGRTRIKT